MATTTFDDDDDRDNDHRCLFSSSVASAFASAFSATSSASVSAARGVLVLRRPLARSPPVPASHDRLPSRLRASPRRSRLRPSPSRDRTVRTASGRPGERRTETASAARPDKIAFCPLRPPRHARAPKTRRGADADGGSAVRRLALLDRRAERRNSGLTSKTRPLGERAGDWDSDFQLPIFRQDFQSSTMLRRRRRAERTDLPPPRRRPKPESSESPTTSPIPSSRRSSSPSPPRPGKEEEEGEGTPSRPTSCDPSASTTRILLECGKKTEESIPDDIPEIIKEAYKVMKTANMNPQDYSRYQDEQVHEHFERLERESSIRKAEKAIKKAQSEGLAEGLAEGLSKGISVALKYAPDANLQEDFHITQEQENKIKQLEQKPPAPSDIEEILLSNWHIESLDHQQNTELLGTDDSHAVHDA